MTTRTSGWLIAQAIKCSWLVWAWQHHCSVCGLSVQLSVCHSVCLSVCMPVCPSLRPNIRQLPYLGLCVCSSFLPSPHPSVCLSAHLPVRLFVRPSVSTSIHLSVCLSVWTFVSDCLPTCLYVCLFVLLWTFVSDCLPTCLYVCLFVCFGPLCLTVCLLVSTSVFSFAFSPPVPPLPPLPSERTHMTGFIWPLPRIYTHSVYDNRSFL